MAAAEAVVTVLSVALVVALVALGGGDVDRLVFTKRSLPNAVPRRDHPLLMHQGPAAVQSRAPGQQDNLVGATTLGRLVSSHDQFQGAIILTAGLKTWKQEARF